MTTPLYLLIFFTILLGCGGNAQNNALLLPITINPLVQDAIQLDNFTKSFIQLQPTFFENVTFNDIVKSLDLPSLPQLKKKYHAIFILGLAAQAHGLTGDKFEFLQTSKWAINVSIKDLASVSNNITLPISYNNVTLIAIQDAMFKVLEKRFNFKTEEIAQKLNKTKDQIYAFLEPGWTKVINFITNKTILTLSENYTIPPFYIAEALNMSLEGLHDVTLPQLEDILVNKIDLIREAAERWKIIISSSIAALLRHSSTTFSTAFSTMVQKNSTIPTTIEQTTTTVVQPSSPSQTDTKTSIIFNKSSSHLEMILTSSKHFSGTLDSISTIFLQNSSMLDIASSSFLIIGSKTAGSSFATKESSSAPEIQTSTLLLTQTPLPTSMYHTSVSIAIAKASQSESSINVRTEMTSISYQISTTQISMFQLNTTRELLPSNTEMVLSTTIESSMLSKSSNIVGLVASKSSSVLLQPTSSTIIDTSSNKKHISSTQHMSTIPIPSISMMYKSSGIHRMTTTQILSTSANLPQSSSVIKNVSSIKASQNSNNTSSTASTVSSYKPTFNAQKSKTLSLNAMKSRSIAKIISVVITSSVIVTSSHTKASTESPKLSTSSYQKIISSTLKVPPSSHLKISSQSSSLVTTSSQLPKNRQTTPFATESLQSVVSSSEESSNSRSRQSTKILQRSPIFTSTADGLHSRTIAPLKSSSYHSGSSFSQQQATTSLTTPVIGNTPKSAKSEDGPDTVVLIVIPILCVLFVTAIVLAIVMWFRHKRRQKSANQKNAENGSELSSRGLVESLENINNRPSGFINKGADDRSSRSMSRTSSISNLETIQEGHEPEEPEIYDL